MSASALFDCVSQSGVLMASRAGRSTGLIKSNSSIYLFEFKGLRRGGRVVAFAAVGRFFHAQFAEASGVLAAFLLNHVYAARNHAAFAGVEERGFFRNNVLLESFKARFVKRAPPEGMAGLDDFVKGFTFALALH